jgi:phage shock protein A
MFKKVLLTGLIGGAGALALCGTAGWSYLRTGIHEARESVRSNVPIEWEIKRARQMINDLKPEIAKNMELVAREEVDVQRLAADINCRQQLLSKARQDILRLKGDLESGSVKFVYAGRKYTADQVRDDLANRFKQFQVHEKTTETHNQVLSAREKNLEAARQKLDQMLAAKRQLEIEVENLQARLTMVQVAHTASPVALDDSHLSHTKDLLDSIRTRIDVAEKMMANEGVLEGNIPLEETVSPKLLDEIADYFGQGHAEVEALVSADGEF